MSFVSNKIFLKYMYYFLFYPFYLTVENILLNFGFPSRLLLSTGEIQKLLDRLWGYCNSWSLSGGSSQNWWFSGLGTNSFNWRFLWHLKCWRTRCKIFLDTTPGKTASRKTRKINSNQSYLPFSITTDNFIK